jgi:hypothetical protein
MIYATMAHAHLTAAFHMAQQRFEAVSEEKKHKEAESVKSFGNLKGIES